MSIVGLGLTLVALDFVGDFLMTKKRICTGHKRIH